MTTITNLRKILETLEKEGLGEEMVCAEHDQIYLAPPDKIAEDSPAGILMDDLGAMYNDSEGWSIFV